MLAQSFAYGNQQIDPPNEEVLKVREGVPYTRMDAPLEHVGETFVGIVHDRFTLQFPQHETEWQRIQIVAVHGVKRRSQSPPQHLEVKPRIKENLRCASTVARRQENALNLNAFHQFRRRSFQIAVPCQNPNLAAHPDQRQRFLPHPRIGVVNIGEQHQDSLRVLIRELHCFLLASVEAIRVPPLRLSLKCGD